LTGLPILGFLQLLGGVDPNLVLVGFAGTALTMLSLASLGILNSAYCDRPRTAIFLTYLQAGAFLLFSYPTPGLRYGNLFAAWDELMRAAAAGDLAKAAPGVIRGYAVIHGLIAILCCIWAAARLRVWVRCLSFRQQELPVLSVSMADGTMLILRQHPSWPYTTLPSIPEKPLLWKETHLESRASLGSGTRYLLTFLLILGCFIGFLAFFAGLALAMASSGVPDFTIIWVREFGTVMASALLVGVALRAAAAISGERERKTLDSLLSTPQDDRAILWAKAWGSILSVRRGWWCLCAIWGLGIIFQGLFPFCVIPMAACWLAHAALIAGIGIWFSLVSRTTLRATMYTLLTIAALYVVPFFLGGLSDQMWLAFSGYREPEWFESFRTVSISAPVTLWSLAYRALDSGSQDNEEFLAALLGIPITASLAAAIWCLIWARFARVTGRMSATGVPSSRERIRVPTASPSASSISR
jgi:hypothetical protein